jgi:hypothetical protein
MDLKQRIEQLVKDQTTSTEAAAEQLCEEFDGEEITAFLLELMGKLEPPINRMLQAIQDLEISPQELQCWLIQNLNDHPDQLETALKALEGSPVYKECRRFLKSLTPDTELILCSYPEPQSIRPSPELLQAVAELP